jgi:N6-adenosine-specific RNA methylase IME4
MTEIILTNNNLPTEIEDLTRFVLVGREKMVSVRAEIRAINKLGLGKEVRQQKLDEGQMISESLLDAEVRIGELMAQMPKATKWDTAENQSCHEGTLIKPKTQAIGEIGFSKKQASHFEALAKHPEVVAQAKAEAREADDIVSRSFVLEKIKAKEREDKQSRVAETVTEKRIPTGKYEVIYADPPWRYDFSETKSRDIENQYPTMTVEEIAELQIPSADNAVLFLWATAPKLPEAFEVLNAWGFQYKTCAVWDKEKIGMGYWFRGQHELLLVGVKGQVSPPSPQTRQSSIYRESRGEHSAKPEHYYKLIETMFPDCSCLELFARKRHSERWEVWGNQL